MCRAIAPQPHRTSCSGPCRRNSQACGARRRRSGSCFARSRASCRNPPAVRSARECRSTIEARLPFGKPTIFERRLPCESARDSDGAMPANDGQRTRKRWSETSGPRDLSRASCSASSLRLAQWNPRGSIATRGESRSRDVGSNKKLAAARATTHDLFLWQIAKDVSPSARLSRCAHKKPSPRRGEGRVRGELLDDDEVVYGLSPSSVRCAATFSPTGRRQATRLPNGEKGV